MEETAAQNVPQVSPGSVNIIAACDENRAIGRAGKLPWHIRDDWRWFLERTRGGACVIGRISYEAMLNGGSVNDKRKFFVVSHNQSLAGLHAQVFPECQEALNAAQATGLPVWICGGPRIYKETMSRADRIYLTLIHAKLEGCDAWIPEWKDCFSETPSYESRGKDNNFYYSFLVFDRKKRF